MSHPATRAHARVTKISLGVLAAGSALAIASAVIPSTGAWFFESQTGKVIATTAKMDFTVTDDNGLTVNNGQFELRYDGLAPGGSVTRSFTVTNTGSLPGTMYLDLSKLVATGGDPDFTKLTYAVGNATPFNLPGNSSKSVALGTLQPGEQQVVQIAMALDGSAGSEWQDVTITNQLDISLHQAH